TESAWTGLAIVVYLGLILGTVIVTSAIRGLSRAWASGPADGPLASLARLFRTGRNRRIFLAASAGYVVFFGWFVSLYAFSSNDPGIWMPSYPAATNVLCCGPPGYTPTAILVLTPSFELVAYPLVLILLMAGTFLFAANVTATVALVRRVPSSFKPFGSLTLGGLGAVFVNCPVCGTILLFNAVAGTATAGLLAGWAANQLPFMLAAFPLSIASLLWAGRQLSAPRAGKTCALPPTPVSVR
ncbi:hypothetical protein B1B_11088, partial [mine drainage metagenome]